MADFIALRTVYRLACLAAASLVVACETPPEDGPPGIGPPPGEEIAQCQMKGAFVINLNRDNAEASVCGVPLEITPNSAAMKCIAREIRANVPDECQGSYDVYVPGTAAEFGTWKQFNSMFSEPNGRAHISLQYQDSNTRWGPDIDPANYDGGVRDAYFSLVQLLLAIMTELETEDVRIFGHSKGSHSVAVTAQIAAFRNMDFYAFAQAGRTAVDIDGPGLVPKGDLGTPGYIEKERDNLVTITWANDEVQFYKGGDIIKTSSLSMPRIWRVPGLSNDRGPDGYLGKVMRIDHHNNYGGNYTDGLSGNDWREGEGSVDPNYPYCASGSGHSWRDDDPVRGCSKRAVSQHAYFWGDEACRARAFSMMARGKKDDRYWIGDSGPRGEDCKPNPETLHAEIGVRYRIDMKEENLCDYNLKIKLMSPDGRTTHETIDLSSGTSHGWRNWPSSGKRAVSLPNHIRVQIDASMSESNAGSMPWSDNCRTPGASAAYIRELRLSFDHPRAKPGDGKTHMFAIYGPQEGEGNAGRLHGDNGNAWQRIDSGKSQDSWDIYHEDESIQVKGATAKGRHGSFYKEVYLLD